MKKKLAVLFILFAAVLTAGSVSDDLVKKQHKIKNHLLGGFFLKDYLFNSKRPHISAFGE